MSPQISYNSSQFEVTFFDSSSVIPSQLPQVVRLSSRKERNIRQDFS
jgi:hypothetical protein